MLNPVYISTSFFLKKGTTYVDVKDPVRLGDLSVEIKLPNFHLRIWVCGSNSQVPPPTPPSGVFSSLLANPFDAIPFILLSPVAVALTLVAPWPRSIEMTISSIGREFVRDVRVSENLPAYQW